MTKSEFVKKIAEKANCTQKVAADMLDTIGAVSMEVMSENDFVPFAFGKIGGKEVAPRTAHNPKTGETINVPAKSGYPYAKFNAGAKSQD